MTENVYSNYDDIEPILPDDFEEKNMEDSEAGAKEADESDTLTMGREDDGEADNENEKTEKSAENGTEDSGESNEQEAKKPETFKVRYNHTDKELTLEEMTALAQKGMKFDEVADDLRLSKEIAARLGHKNIAAMAKAVDDSEIKKRVEEYVDEGVPEKLAQRLAKEDYEKENLVIATKKKDESERIENVSGEALKAEVAEFNKAFPDVKVIPNEVIALKQQRGLNLTAAYGVYLSNKAQTENKALKQKAEVTKKAPVRSATQNGGTVKKAVDPFLAGFDED